MTISMESELDNNDQTETVDIVTSSTENEEEIDVLENDTVQTTDEVKVPYHDRQSWTVRLILSDSFNASMAIEYLNSVHDKPALTLLGKRLFDLPKHEIDFFLPQLMHLYVSKVDAASVTHAYIEKRYKEDVQFTIVCIWLLDSFTKSLSNNGNHAFMLKSLLTDDPNSVRNYKTLEILSLDNLEESNWIVNNTKNTTTKIRTTIMPDVLKQRPIPKMLLSGEQKFITRLIHIGSKMSEIHLLSSKQEKTTFLHSELHMLNSMLPKFVWIPFDFENTILNICVDESAILNSKDKVPYIFFAEIVRSNPDMEVDPIVTFIDKELPVISETPKKSKSGRNKIQFDATDPSVAVFAESWSEKKSRIHSLSQYKHYSNWDLMPVIVKTGDDLTQEAFAQQLLFTFKDLWKEEGVPLYLRPYKIICIGGDAGLIEPVLDTMSLHQIKRNLSNASRIDGNLSTPPTLKKHFENVFGPVGCETHVNAQKNFIQSAAAYSLVSYFLQLKDRHNGNILLDMEGHLIHIDYGFLLSSSPRNLGFETAPFKLTSELIDVMGGFDSDMFLYYKSLLLRGLMAARKHHRRIISLAEVMSTGSKMQCFRNGIETIRALESRFHVSSTDEQLQQHVDYLVEGSRDSYTTRFYDSFQYYTNGIH